MKRISLIAVIIISAILLVAQTPWSVSTGLRSRYSSDNKFGENTAVGTSFEDVWTNSGAKTYLASAEVMAVEGGSTDDAGMAGALTVKLIGLDGSFNPVEETVTMDGTTPVDTTATFIRLNRMFVVTAGSGGGNAGIIIAKDTSANVIGQIEIGENQTLQTHFTVPAGKTMIIGKMFGDVGKNDDATFRLRVRLQGEVFRTRFSFGLFQGDAQHDFENTMLIPEKSDVAIQAKSAAGGVDASAGWNFVLRDN